MVKPAPDSFNPELVARQSSRSAGTSFGGSAQAERLSVAFPLSKCKRLVELLAADSGHLEGEFEVKRAGRQILIEGHFSTEFTLECQRCLTTYVQPVMSEFAFVLVPDQAAADALPEEQDPLITGEDGMLNVVDIFEDELILLLPTVPRHTSVEDCSFEVAVDIQPGSQSGSAKETDGTTEADAGVQRGADVFAELKNLRFDK